MIGFLEGKIVVQDDPYLVIDVGGVGYRVLVSKDVFTKSISNGQRLKVFTYTHVRDDAIELFGFADAEDLKLFRHFLTVSGIGPKTAMNIFAVGNRNSIAEAIVRGDVEFFSVVPRLGRKNAQRIIIELKNKFGSVEDLDLSGDTNKDNETIFALKSFGFSTKEAQDALRATKGAGKTIEERIRLALKFLGAGKNKEL